MALDQQDLLTLQTMPLFSGLPEPMLLRVIGNSSPRSYDRGQVLFEAGDPAERFYVVLEGWVKLCRRSIDGHEVVVRVLARGETFAEAVMFLRGKYPVSAEIIRESRLLSIEFDSIASCVRDDPGVALGMLASTSVHLKDLVEQIEQIKGQTGIRRVGDFILKLCPSYEGSAVVGLPYEKSLIAARLGMTPESFSRALARLRDVGVKTDRDHVIVSDIQQLSAFLNADDPSQQDMQP